MLARRADARYFLHVWLSQKSLKSTNSISSNFGGLFLLCSLCAIYIAQIAIIANSIIFIDS